MPDKGWRKKIHGKQARDLPPLKTTPRDVANGEDDRRRPMGWRKTIQGSRPDTPSSISPLTPTIDDPDEVRSEHSEPQTPRRNSKPKLARYTSLFSSFKESSKGPEFIEPWSEDAPPPFQPYVDPLHALQAVRSHMINLSTPIPLEHNSGLFRVFEDYRKVRHEKERLESLLEKTLTDWKTAEAHWADSEFCYKAEIRRLEILIANGTSGMAGLFKARQGSVIDRKRGHRKTFSYDKPSRIDNFISNTKLDNEIQARIQQVTLYRPVSPSEKMATLSKYLMNTHADQLPTGPSNTQNISSLSRRAHSERNLTCMARDSEHCFISNLVVSDKGNMPLDKAAVLPMSVNSEHELDAFIALRELGGLVAERRGIEADIFVDGLMALLSNINKVQSCRQSPDETHQSPLSTSRRKPQFLSRDAGGLALTRRRTLRRFQSQPQLSIHHQLRRHFSFDLGDDQLHELEEFDTYAHSPAGSSSSALDMSQSPQQDSIMLRTHSAISTPSSQTLSAESQRPSKIPSPVGTLGRTRREDSTSSLQTVIARPADGRRDSNSSIRTGTSANNLRASESTAASKALPDSCRDPGKIAVLTAAERGDNRTPPGTGTGSLATGIAASSFSAALLFGRLQLENVESKNSPSSH
ncbi:hypothetical protein T440DRAFT_452633 [Plenodomus tracheiphilus IPT5]|uniref:Uncharacterized protein n=1 Tax=Plenodomus tracheiphilus IPT5 TaxID=1408161 RepID=A0A6A7B1D2_9PLEO|nr:hypothetical protein T440DRAFT_452633 [Plenodomus tracheiphilus IPT5]